MVAFLFGLFIFLFIGVGAFKLFGAKKMGKFFIFGILAWAGALITQVLILKFFMVGGPQGVAILVLLGIAIFVIMAIFLAFRTTAKVFGGKSVAKFMLFTFGIIIFIIIAIGGVVFFAKSFLGFS